MNYADLAREQARHPLLILVQLLVEALLHGHLSRLHLTLLRDLSCAILTQCGVGLINEALLNLFMATYGVVQLSIWQDPVIPITLSPLDIPDNPARGFSILPLSRIFQGPYRDHLSIAQISHE